jgi:hypothetical protein
MASETCVHVYIDSSHTTYTTHTLHTTSRHTQKRVGLQDHTSKWVDQKKKLSLQAAKEKKEKTNHDIVLENKKNQDKVLFKGMYVCECVCVCVTKCVYV